MLSSSTNGTTGIVPLPQLETIISMRLLPTLSELVAAMTFKRRAEACWLISVQEVGKCTDTLTLTPNPRGNHDYLAESRQQTLERLIGLARPIHAANQEGLANVFELSTTEPGDPNVHWYVFEPGLTLPGHNRFRTTESCR